MRGLARGAGWLPARHRVGCRPAAGPGPATRRPAGPGQRRAPAGAGAGPRRRRPRPGGRHRRGAGYPLRHLCRARLALSHRAFVVPDSCPAHARARGGQPGAARPLRHRPAGRGVRPAGRAERAAEPGDRGAAVRRRPGHRLRPAAGARCGRAPLRPGRPHRARHHRPALLDLDAGADAARGAGPRAHRGAGLRGAHGHGAVDAPGALRAHRPALSPVRHAVLAAGAVPRVLLRAGLPLAAAVARPAGVLVRVERAGGDLGRRRRAVRARVRQPAPVLAARVPGFRLARGRLRGARLRQRAAGLSALRSARRGGRQPHVPRQRGVHPGRVLPRLAQRQPCRRLVPHRLGAPVHVPDPHRAAPAVRACG